MMSAREIASRSGAPLALMFSSWCAVGVAGCDHASNSGLGQGTFTYACPSATAGEPGADAWCDTGGGGIPNVAVGAPFGLQYGAEPPKPAVSSLAQSTQAGWLLMQPGWLGFIVWSGSDVLDYTHVLGRPVAKLRLQPDTFSIRVGETPKNLAAIPLADDGTTLGGAIACTFSSSDPNVVSVTNDGRVARVTAHVASGHATIAASCMGQDAQSSVSTAGAEGDGGEGG